MHSNFYDFMPTRAYVIKKLEPSLIRHNFSVRHNDAAW